MVVVNNATGVSLNINPAFKSMYFAQGFKEPVAVELEKVEIPTVKTEKEVVTESEDSATEKPKLTKTDVKRMGKPDLISLALSLGIEASEESKGNDLKDAIIAKLGL